MKEKEIKNYALNGLSFLFGLSFYQVRFKGSMCDFICIDENAYSIEVEHKSGKYMPYEFEKPMKCNNKQPSVFNKHNETKKGKRVNYFYYLIPAQYYRHYKSEIPNMYGIITYETSGYKTKFLDMVIVRKAKMLSTVPMSGKDVLEVCNTHQPIIEVPELPINEYPILFLKQEDRGFLGNTCIYPERLK